jgi:hypothetical protein
LQPSSYGCACTYPMSFSSLCYHSSSSELQKPKFYIRTVHVTSILGVQVLGQVSVTELLCYPVSIISAVLHIYCVSDAGTVHYNTNVLVTLHWYNSKKSTHITTIPKDYSYSTTNKMHLLSQIIFSCKILYMFWTVFPSIIRSSKLCILQRYMSNTCCYRGSASHPR